MTKKRIVFLASGGGGTLKFVFNAIHELKLPIVIVGIITDRETDLQSFAEAFKIYFKRIKYYKSSPERLQNELKLTKPDIIITNIHKIIDKETLEFYPNRFINLHYSLLPSFSGIIGMETIHQAKSQNVGFIGGTCHEVNEFVDAGKILHQGAFAVDWEKDNNIVDTVFKTSCLAILGGIMTKLEIVKNKTNKLVLNDKNVYFSPALPVDNLTFSNNFWNNIKCSKYDTI